jgi:AcrR family transcriptional regulator
MSYSEKQIQIIDAAEKLFSDRGFDGTSVRDIAEKAGINIAMISYYFGSKEKLMQAIFEQRTSQMTERIEVLLKDEKLSPFEKIDILIEDYVDRVEKKIRFHKLMVCEQIMGKNLVVTGLLVELKKKNAALIERLIEDGQKKKVFRKGIDVVLLINTMVGTVMHTYTNHDYYKDYNKLDMTGEAYEIFLREKLTKHIKGLFKAILSYEG